VSSRRAKMAATATVLGLGGLAAVAMETNHGLPHSALGGASSAVVTQASGAGGSAQATALTSNHAPIVTRASGAGAGAPLSVED
jgi:hypothetical protein